MAARITGRLGTVNMGGGVIADTFNWTMEFEVELAECGIKNEKVNPVSVGASSIRITAERWVQNTATPTKLTNLAVAAGVSADDATQGAPVEYTLFQIAGGATGATITGTGVVSRGSLNAPRSLVNDTLEIQGTNMPTVT